MVSVARRFTSGSVAIKRMEPLVWRIVPVCRSAGGLTRLSKWWVDLGIRVHRTRPGTPTQNARHERMHGSLNRAIGGELRGADTRTQQAALQAFRQEFNEQRSHEALNRQTPASTYQPSQRIYSPVLRPIEYA